MNIILKSCPFCGSSVEPQEESFKTKIPTGMAETILYQIKCHGCGIGFSSSKKEIVFDKWQKRAKHE